MKFVLEVDLDAVSGEPEAELGRILRYWGGNLKHVTLQPGESMAITDSAYANVGVWKVVASETGGARDTTDA